MKNVILVTLLIILSSSAYAEPDKKPKPVEPRPKIETGNIPERTIKIIDAQKYTMQEIRINGVLRAIRVKPKSKAPAYLLIDRDGDGNFVRVGAGDQKIVVPEWVLFEW